MFDGVKIFATKARQGSAVDLGIATYIIVNAGFETLPFSRVDPVFFWLVAAIIKDSADLPVLRLLRQEVSALDQQDARAAITQRVCKCPAPHAGTDDDKVVVLCRHLF